MKKVILFTVIMVTLATTSSAFFSGWGANRIVIDKIHNGYVINASRNNDPLDEERIYIAENRKEVLQILSEIL